MLMIEEGMGGQAVIPTALMARKQVGRLGSLTLANFKRWTHTRRSASCSIIIINNNDIIVIVVIVIVTVYETWESLIVIATWAPCYRCRYWQCPVLPQ